jgi:hypothetical protein
MATTPASMNATIDGAREGHDQEQRDRVAESEIGQQGVLGHMESYRTCG